jgi:hypothetical protein
MGYYSDDSVERPYLDVKTILHRNDPILTCAPQHKPVDETGLLKGVAGAAQIWRALNACGLPDVLGVWNHEAGPATRFTAIQIRQRYPGHARNVLHVASNCQGGAYAGDVYPVRPAHGLRHHSEGLGLEARSPVPARKFQQPNPDRRLHPIRKETPGNVSAGGGCEPGPAGRAQGEISRIARQSLTERPSSHPFRHGPGKR